MDEEANKIRQHIDYEREQLGRNLDEIEDRMKNLTDVKSYFNRNTGWILGAAVAGGFLLSLAVSRDRAQDSTLGPEALFNERGIDTPVRTSSGPSRFHRVSETFDDIFEGLAGVASDKLHSFVADAVPGFREHYDAVGRQRGRN